MGFFRGIESKYQTQIIGMRQIPEAVIGIVGLAPIHHVLAENRTVNQLKIVNSDVVGASLFGPDVPELAGYTLPMAVTVNSLESGPLMLAINVFDPAVHKKAMTEETVTFDLNDKAQLTQKDIISAVVKSENGNTTYVLDVDYSLDRVTGKMRRVADGGIAIQGKVKVTGVQADPSAVTTAEIIGAISNAGVRTGLKVFDVAFQLFGVQPTDLIAPGFEALPSVRLELARLAGELKAHCHIAYPLATTVEQALSSRGPTGPHEMQVSNSRIKLHYPHVELPQTDGTTRLVPMSLVYACVWGRTIMEDGFWCTGSNRPMNSVIGLERPITIGKETDDANLLNAAGITTVRSAWGASITPWGPSSSAFPEITDPIHFDCVQRFFDITDRVVEMTLTTYIDRPLTPAFVRMIVGVINDYYLSLIKKGGLIDGRCSFHVEDNPPEQLAQGHFVTRDQLAPPPPFQRLTRITSYNKGAIERAFQAI